MATASPQVKEALALAPAVDVARAEVDRLVEVELDYARIRATKKRELAELQCTAGDVVLNAALAGNGKAAQDVEKRLARLRAEIDVADLTVVAAHAARVKAIPGIFRAQAAEIRGRVAELQGKAADRQRKTTELLTALHAWEGVRYVPEPAPARPSGSAYGDPVVVAVPKTALMLLEISEMELQAKALESRRVESVGHVIATSIDDLLAQVAADPLVNSPAPSEILQWVEDGTASIRELQRRRQGNGFSADLDRPLAFDLTWHDGRIDAAESIVGVHVTQPFDPNEEYPEGVPVITTTDLGPGSTYWNAYQEREAHRKAVGDVPEGARAVDPST